MSEWIIWWKLLRLSCCGPHQSCNASQKGHLNKSRLLSHWLRWLFQESFWSRISLCRLGVCSCQLPNRPSAMYNSGCNFGMQAQRRNAHWWADPEMAARRAGQPTACPLQRQAERGVLWGLSHTKQLRSCQAACMGATLMETQILPSCLGSSPSALHWGRRHKQRTFLAAKGEHKPNQWAQTGTSFDMLLNGSLIPLLLHFPPGYGASLVLLWGWQLMTEIQHIPQTHSLRFSCVCLNDKINVAICCRTYEIPSLSLCLFLL